MQIATSTLSSREVWTTQSAFEAFRDAGMVGTKRTAERRLRELGVLTSEVTEASLRDEFDREPNRLVFRWALERARSKRHLVLFAQLHCTTQQGATILQVNDARGGRFWTQLDQVGEVIPAITRLQQYVDKPIVLFPHGALVKALRSNPSIDHVTLCMSAYAPVLELPPSKKHCHPLTPHLKSLEAESIRIIREAVAESANPAMLYSVGKDSAVMLHLARKAFYPASPPFPLLHVDTRWKFQEMYLLRDQMAKMCGMELLVHINPEAIEKDINPFDHGSALHTNITKTEGLKQALNRHGFDLVFGGARRDEEKSRAKERIFSFRSASHRWDPKNQRPEPWNLFNTRKEPGESTRVFPLSNWTELDIWQYIYQENIPVVPLYFAKERPVVVRNGLILVVDDSRFRMLPGEKITQRCVRFRTLGCYPLTGAVESRASTLEDILLELISARSSERQGRAIDADASSSMEKKKQEGYF